MCASIFKVFNSDDIISSRTLLHEAIPITGSIISGTYNDLNIKNYSHGMWQSVFDFPIASSSANHMFDITFGYSANSELSGASVPENNKKINIFYMDFQVLRCVVIAYCYRLFPITGNIDLSVVPPRYFCYVFGG